MKTCALGTLAGVCFLFAAAAAAVPATPSNAHATTVSNSQVQVSWTAVATAVSYDVYRSTSGGAYTKAGSTTTTGFSDIALPSNTTFQYEVQAIDGSGVAGPLSNAAMATTTVFSDDPLVGGATAIKGVHILELRTAVNAVRAAAGLSSGSFTDSSLAGVAIKSIHITELRDSLNQALTVLAMPALVPTNSAAPGTVVAAVDVSEIRGHVSGLTSTRPAPVSFCARGPATQTFSTAMQACAGTVPFANRGTMCGPNSHVCTANEWIANYNAISPQFNYWTSDVLRAGVGGSTNHCFVSLSTVNTVACTTSMLVCAAAVDPLGNTCNWTGCGLDTTTNQSFGGCPGASAGSLCCSNQASPILYVNAATGLDTNNGTAAAPFKTITHALSIATYGQVNVAPATYSTGSGETFPLNVPVALALIGDEANSGAGVTATLISGCGLTASGVQAAIVGGGGSTIAGFTITCTSGQGILAPASSLTIRNNTLTANQSAGIDVINNSTNHVIVGNTIRNNGYGVYFSASVAGGLLENNVITNNSYGVLYNTPGADLGSMTGSSGGNVISCNANTDLWIKATVTNVSAMNNKWDHNPPTLSTTTYGAGLDIYAPGGVVATGASLAPTICP